MSAGGLAGYGLLIFVCLLFIGLIGGVVDRTANLNSVMVATQNTTLPVSQDRIETTNWLVWGFRAIPIMIILAGGYNYWVTNIRDQSGGV